MMAMRALMVGAPRRKRHRAALADRLVVYRLSTWRLSSQNLRDQAWGRSAPRASTAAGAPSDQEVIA